MRKLDVRLVRHMSHSKGQFIALSMVIVLGLMMYVAMNSAYINLSSSLEYHYDQHNFAEVFAEVMKITESDIEDLREIPGVEAAEGRLVYDVPLNVGNEEKVNVRLVSSSYGEDSINSLYALEGRSVVNSDTECLVVEKFALARNIQVGDIISPHISGRDYDLEVVGIVSSPEYVYLMENDQTLLPAAEKFGILFTTESFISDAIGVGSSYNQVLFILEKDLNVDEYVKTLEKKLDKFGVTRIYDQDDQLSNRMVHEEMRGLEQSSSTVPVIFLGVAAFIMGVMISRMVKGDRLAIGILKSMGYSNSDVILHYTKLSVVVGLLGGSLGVILGYLLSMQFTQIYIDFFSIPTLRFVFRPELILLSAILVSIFSVAAGLWGSRKSMKISPAESMRPEPPKTGKRILLERTWLWKHISFSNKMVFRNLFRSKKRAFFIALGISLTFAITLMPFFMLSAFNDMFDTMYGEFQTMDYVLNFSSGANEDIIYDLRNTLDIDEIEGKLEFPFELQHEWKTKVVNIVGVKENTQFFNFQDENFNPIYLKPGDFFMSEGLANVLGIKIGDYLTVSSFIPDRDDIEIKVTGIVKQNLGANGYMILDDMQGLLMDDDYINGAYIATDQSLKDEVEKYKVVASIQTTQDLQDTFKEFLGLMIMMLSIMIMFGGILGFAIIYNSAVIAINERRLEFSSLRVMGFTKNEIFISLLKENIINAILGIILGVPIARAMLESLSSTFSTELYSFDILLEPMHYGLTAITVIIFVIIALLAAYRKIHGLNFIEALKNRIT
ncbi:FtsX-like permease family protein [Acidaminobacter sp. JC074]|uniref:ABC transporter permease n=1 Tax=Acidaminobacter sp. JC074 TaxID=2530199 RepID=UPI001F0EB27D|nr:FtsX-like permease family protein [Acidaminobacter sp. JC074]